MGRVAAVVATLVMTVGCTGTAPPVPSAAPAPSGLEWHRLAAAPSMRTEVAAAAAGTSIYVVGGYRGDGATVATVEVLDTVSGRWAAGPDLPVAVNHAMAATLGGEVYVFGGYLSGNVPSTAAFRLDPTAGTAGWRAVAELPQGRAAGTVVSLDTMAYLAGGIAPGGRLADQMLVYDVVADRWSVALGPPTPREHLGGAGFDGLVYTVGGRTAGAGNLAAVEVYDPRTGQWSSLPGLPTRRGGLAAAATCSGYVVAVGGEAQATFDEAEAYEVRAKRWLSLPVLPTARHGLGVVAVGTVVYTLAGGPRPGLHVSSATEAIDVAALGPCG